MHAHSKSSPPTNAQGADSGAATKNASQDAQLRSAQEESPAQRQRQALAALGKWTGLFGGCVHRLWIAVAKRKEMRDLHEFTEPIQGYCVRRIPPEEITLDERVALGMC